MSTGQLKYFFSYARKDTEFVLKLATELRAVGVNVWLDQLDILGGQRWDRAIEDALKGCQGTIAVLSPESLASNNVMDEISYALEEGKLVVPILLRRCDVPFRLRLVQHVDFSTDYDLGFSRLLRALGVERPPVVAERETVKTQVAPEVVEPQAVKAEVPPAAAEPPLVKTQVAQAAAEPQVVKAEVPPAVAEPQVVETQVTQGVAQPFAEPTTTPVRRPPPEQKTRPRWWSIVGLLLFLWLFGIGAHVGGAAIHVVLIVAVSLLIYNLVSGRRKSNELSTPVALATGALARHPTRAGIIFGTVAAAIWGSIVVGLIRPSLHFEAMLSGLVFVGPAGLIAGAICKMRWKVAAATIVGSLVGWGFAANFIPSTPMAAGVFGTSIGMILGSIAGAIIGKVKGWK